MQTMISAFSLLEENTLRSLRALRLIFFSSSSEGAETFLISYAMNKWKIGKKSAIRNQAGPHWMSAAA
jgi:hypothetical protein